MTRKQSLDEMKYEAQQIPCGKNRFRCGTTAAFTSTEFEWGMGLSCRETLNVNLRQPSFQQFSVLRYLKTFSDGGGWELGRFRELVSHEENYREFFVFYFLRFSFHRIYFSLSSFSTCVECNDELSSRLNAFSVIFPILRDRPVTLGLLIKIYRQTQP